MATIKSFTDISQSKKLAKILPLESADMHYNNGSCRGVDYTEHFSAELMPYQEALYLIKIHKTNFMFQVIPCWSLATLLDVLPKNLNIGRPSLESNYNGYYWIQYYDEFMKPNNYKTECFDNPVDACVSMIEKLNELNLL